METAIPQYLHHFPVVSEHLAFEKADAFSPCYCGQLLQQVSSNALPLVCILYYECHLGGIFPGKPIIAAYSNNSLFSIFNNCGHQGEAAIIVNGTKALHFFLRHLSQDMVEPEISSMTAQTVKESEQLFFILRPDRPER
jgi:hypothetical protein